MWRRGSWPNVCGIADARVLRTAPRMSRGEIKGQAPEVRRAQAGHEIPRNQALRRLHIYAPDALMLPQKGAPIALFLVSFPRTDHNALRKTLRTNL